MSKLVWPVLVLLCLLPSRAQAQGTPVPTPWPLPMPYPYCNEPPLNGGIDCWVCYWDACHWFGKLRADCDLRPPEEQADCYAFVALWYILRINGCPCGLREERLPLANVRELRELYFLPRGSLELLAGFGGG